MPCTCDGYPEPDNTHNGELAEMLCKTMWAHEQKGALSCFSEEQLRWWEEHKKRDRDRILQDLSQYERYVLGL